MSRMNRAFQLQVLQKLRDVYPQGAQPADMGFSADDPEWMFNTQYLLQHGLIEGVQSRALSRPNGILLATITAAGLDFLEDDGGLSAILGTVTVRLHADTLKALLLAKVDASSLPAAEKSVLKEKLQELGSEAISAVAKRLLDAALDRWPEALQTIRDMLG